MASGREDVSDNGAGMEWWVGFEEHRLGSMLGHQV